MKIITARSLAVIVTSVLCFPATHAQTVSGGEEGMDNPETSLIGLAAPEKSTTDLDAVPSSKPSTTDDGLDLNKQPTADEGISLAVSSPVKPQNSVAPQPEKKSGKVKVFAPWPAKPISQPPAGWKLIPAPAGTAPHKEMVTLKDGRQVEVSITPYLLVPDSNQETSFKISEPGYKPQQKLNQIETVGSILSQSTAEIENSERDTAAAIRRLQALLSSLPNK